MLFWFNFDFIWGVFPREHVTKKATKGAVKVLKFDEEGPGEGLPRLGNPGCREQVVCSVQSNR